ENVSFSQEIRINGEVAARPVAGLTARMLYQHVRGSSRSESYSHKDSYYVRDLVNAFTQSDGRSVIPHNGIFRTGSPEERYSHFFRAQLDYRKKWAAVHGLNVLAGAEIRHSQSDIYPGSVLYNYEEDYLTGVNLFD